MLRNQLNIYFYVRPSSVENKRGTFYVRVVINGEQMVCSVKSLRMYEKEFDLKTQNPKKNCELYFECLAFMQQIRQELNKIHLDFERKRHIFTKEHLVSSVDRVFYRVKHGRELASKTYLEIYQEMIDHQAKAVGKTLSRGTYNVRKRYKKIFAKTLAEAGLGMSPICNFTMRDVEKVREGLINSYALGTAARVFTIFSTAFDYAVKIDLMFNNPCDDVPPIRYSTTTDLVWLEQDEVQKLTNLEVNGQAKRYRDAFIFCCYTGLSIGDYELLNPLSKDHRIKIAESPKNIQPGEIVTLDSGTYIMGRRRKTGTQFRVPITPQAKQIMDEYGGLERLPFNLVKVSHMLNALMDMAQIRKKVRFHTARKSMANYLLNVKMLDPFYVKEIMGWVKIEEAEPYTKVQPSVLAHKLLMQA